MAKKDTLPRPEAGVYQKRGFNWKSPVRLGAGVSSVPHRNGGLLPSQDFI
jgi:hypothetical protein